MLKVDESYKAKHFKTQKYSNKDCPTILLFFPVLMHCFQPHCTVSKYLLLTSFGSMRELLNQYLGVSDQISVDTYHEIPVLSIKLSVAFLSAVEVLLMSICFTNSKDHI